MVPFDFDMFIAFNHLSIVLIEVLGGGGGGGGTLYFPEFEQ